MSPLDSLNFLVAGTETSGPFTLPWFRHLVVCDIYNYKHIRNYYIMTLPCIPESIGSWKANGSFMSPLDSLNFLVAGTETSGPFTLPWFRHLVVCDIYNYKHIRNYYIMTLPCIPEIHRIVESERVLYVPVRLFELLGGWN